MGFCVEHPRLRASKPSSSACAPGAAVATSSGYGHAHTECWQFIFFFAVQKCRHIFICYCSLFAGGSAAESTSRVAPDQVETQPVDVLMIEPPAEPKSMIFTRAFSSFQT